MRIDAVVELIKTKDAIFLSVLSPDGKTAAINLNNLSGPIVRAAFVGWAEREFSDEAYIKCNCGAWQDAGACGHHPSCPMKATEG